MTDLDRRTVIAAGAALAFAPRAAVAEPAPLTAGAVIDRIKAAVGVPWLEKTVDGIVAGDAATPVTGIATTMMATLAVLKRAAAAKLNLIVSHEPTFWSHQEDTTGMTDDPLFHEKRAFIQDNKLVVFHFHDHFHRLKPRDGIAEGMMRRLGWSTYADPTDPQRFTIPETTVGDLTRMMQHKLKAATIRTIGNPDAKVTKVATSWGYVQKANGVAVFNDPADFQVFVIGECWEWELQEYTADLVSAGRNKALIMVGHIESEQWGMDYCAEWLRGFVKEVPVQFLEMPEPYWSPRPGATRGTGRRKRGSRPTKSR